MSRLIDETSIPSLLKEMTVGEKVELLIGGSIFSTKEMVKYGIPSLLYLDGATGVNIMQYVSELAFKNVDAEHTTPDDYLEENESCNESGSAYMGLVDYIAGDMELPERLSEDEKKIVLFLRERLKEQRPEGEEPNCFPPGMLLGATWNPDVVYRVAAAVAREACAYGIDVLLGTPNVNIHRDPKGGRIFESFSEDPYLTSVLSPMFVKGVQDQGMIADVKHFAANNQETLRQGINEHISERALREIYLPGFEAAVKSGNVRTVMSAYNSINGIPCAQNDWLLNQVLKEEWGFKGQVVSDWGAVYDQVAALNGGNDLDMPGPRSKKRLLQAVKNGEVSMERLDDAVTRMIQTVLKSPSFQGRIYKGIDNEFSQAAAYQAAVEGITLLKNNGILPLKEGAGVSLYGRLTERFMESGAGSAQVNTGKYTSLPVELARYTDCIEMGMMNEYVVIVTVGASGQEGSDRISMDLPVEDASLLNSILRKAKQAGKQTIVLLNVAGPVHLRPYMEHIDALICLYFPGMAGAKAVADILFGKVSPSGKLPISFPETYMDTPTAFNFPGEFGEVTYGEGIYVGYRYYTSKGIRPLYPFGYGLTYSHFTIKDAKVSKSEYLNNAEEPLSVWVVVKNKGAMRAKQVVQLYIHAIHTTLQRPEKELKAFRKIELNPGEEQVVELQIMPQAFASFDTSLHKWIIEPGKYQLLIGDSSDHICADVDVNIVGKNPYCCSLRSSIDFIAAHDELCQICQRILGDKFDIARLRDQAIYFGKTSLQCFLTREIRGIDKGAAQWMDMIQRLDEELQNIENSVLT